QAVPAHAGELRHVFIDHSLAVGFDVAGRAIVGGGGKHVVRAEEGNLLFVVAPAHHALVVEVDGPVRLYGEQRREDGQTEHGYRRRWAATSELVTECATSFPVARASFCLRR